MPILRFCLLVLPTCFLLVVSPLLPFLAYTLWLWAAYSWEWRDRWTSIRAWAKQGGAFVILVLVFAILSSAQVWILPSLAGVLQSVWHAYLGGDLSLSPIDLDGFVARTLLLLPLAPALALLYERIDPRTHVQLQRILTPADLIEPATPKATEEPPAMRSAKPPPKAKAARPPRKRTRKREPAQQVTIDSFLAQKPVQQFPSASPSHQETSQQPVTLTPTSEVELPPAVKPINWDDVAN
jgi:hypothetical protein